jgi:hypothetical protein
MDRRQEAPSPRPSTTAPLKWATGGLLLFGTMSLTGLLALWQAGAAFFR